MSNQRKGDRVTIKNKKHPWHGHAGTLLEYGPYGLTFMRAVGWRIKLDNGQEVYAQAGDL